MQCLHVARYLVTVQTRGASPETCAVTRVPAEMTPAPGVPVDKMSPGAKGNRCEWKVMRSVGE